MAFRSAPAQKVPPVPVRTATEALSSTSNASNASLSPVAVFESTAFFRSGREMATTVTGPSAVTWTELGASAGPGFRCSTSAFSQDRRVSDKHDPSGRQFE